MLDEKMIETMAGIMGDSNIIDFLLTENKKLKTELEYERQRSDRWEKIALASYHELREQMLQKGGEGNDI